MHTTIVLLLVAAFAAAVDPTPLTLESGDARMRRAFALAMEANNADLEGRVLALRDKARAAFDRKDVVAAERLIRDAEQQVGLDPGGKTMHGLPVSQVVPGQKDLEASDERLAEAMRKDDPEGVARVAAERLKLLGDDAGVPDLRRKGDAARPIPVKPADVADVFVRVLEADPRVLKALSAGVPAPGTMPRAYASVVQGCLLIRPQVEQHLKDKLPIIDDLVRGSCKAMVALQLPDGHFKFPDLRGKHLRLGELVERLAMKDPDAVQDGWLVAADPEGSSLHDAGECGLALLRAGAAYKEADWTRAGTKAADWAAGHQAVATWHHNAFAVSLLCEARRGTGEKKYLDAATRRYRVGVRPGQTANGRWMDASEARTANHLNLLRAVQDLEEVSPAGKERDAIAAAARLAVKSICDEAEKLGAPATSHTVQELDRFIRRQPDADKRARGVLEQAASAAVQKCSQGGRVRAVVPLPELAAASRVWPR